MPSVRRVVRPHPEPCRLTGLPVDPCLPTSRANPALLLHAMVFSFLLGGFVPAQVATVLSLQDVVAAMDARGTNVVGAVSPLERLARLARSHFQAEARAKPPKDRRGRRTLIQVAEQPGAMLVSCEQEQLSFMEGIVGQLRKEGVRELRVQCTLVRLPLGVATRHGLLAGGATPVDEVAAGKVQRDAVQAKGSLQNLPEVKIVPLVPFRVEPTADERTVVESSPTLRVRGEAVLAKEQDALFAVQLVAGDLPADATILPKSPLLELTFRLQAGAGVMLLSSAAKDADADAEVVALWLRFVEVATKKPGDKAEGVGPGK